jgi:endonuclease/exonuclease/phosphatase family metal-dependent hydrolase
MRMRTIVVVGLAAIAAIALPVAAEAKKKSKPPKVTVMTRNIYLGSDLTGALLAPSQTEVFEEAGKIWRNVQETNFIARAKPLADEIQDANVDLVGLQEVALWRRDTLGAPDGPASPATEVVYDFLHQLQSELRVRGLDYRVASVQNEADFEIPLDFNDDGTPLGTAYDGRLTMRDVILVKDSKKLKTSNEQSENYGLALPVDVAPAGAGPEDIDVLRGYTAVDVVKKGKKGKGNKKRGKAKFRFVNTHLEAFSAFFRNGQASELVISSGALDSSRPVILVGDLNSDPDDPSIQGPPFSPVPTPNAAAYNTIAGDGFADLGVSENTCCHDDDLLDPPPTVFGSRIDHVLAKPSLKRVGGGLVGADPAFRTPTGLWPSDHGGVFSTLKMPKG